MEKTKKHSDKSAYAAAIVIAAAFLAAGLLENGRTVASDTERFNNLVSLEVKHPSCDQLVDTIWGMIPAREVNPKCGLPSEVQYTHNAITERGLNWTRDRFTGLSADTLTTNNWTVVELSTNAGAPAITDTACANPVTGNGLDIARGAVVNQNYGNYTVTKTFTVSGTQAGIQKVCLSNATASASSFLMASALFSSTNVASGDTLIVNYSVAVR